MTKYKFNWLNQDKLRFEAEFEIVVKRVMNLKVYHPATDTYLTLTRRSPEQWTAEGVLSPHKFNIHIELTEGKVTIFVNEYQLNLIAYNLNLQPNKQ